MPVYEYTAFDQEGRRRKGIVEAGSVAVARQKLRETQIFPIGITESATDGKDDPKHQRPVDSVLKKVGLREVSVMTRQLSTLLGAGLPLVPSPHDARFPDHASRNEENARPDQRGSE